MIICRKTEGTEKDKKWRRPSLTEPCKIYVNICLQNICQFLWLLSTSYLVGAFLKVIIHYLDYLNLDLPIRLLWSTGYQQNQTWGRQIFIKHLCCLLGAILLLFDKAQVSLLKDERTGGKWIQLPGLLSWVVTHLAQCAMSSRISQSTHRTVGEKKNLTVLRHLGIINQKKLILYKFKKITPDFSKKHNLYKEF